MGGSRRLATVGAVVAVVVAVGAFGRFTTLEPPEGADTTVTTTATIPTTTTAPGIVEQGAPIEWFASLVLDAPPLAIVPRNGATVFYNMGAGGVGLTVTVWDGTTVNWSLILEEGLVEGVLESGNSVIAYGYDLASNLPTVWRTLDHANWSSEMLPADRLTGRVTQIRDAHSTDDLVIIAGMTFGRASEADLWELVDQRLGEHFGELFRYYIPNWSFAEIPVDVYGPLDIHLGTITASGLGIDPELLSSPNILDEAGIVTWVSIDGGPWQTHLLDLERGPLDLFDGLDGGVWATSGARGGLLTTTDGSSWPRLPARHGLDVAGPWGTGLFGLTVYGDLVRSDDGFNWNDIELPDTAGWEGWSYSSIASSRWGLALLFQHYDHQRDHGESLIKTSGGYSLWQAETGELSLREGQQERLRFDPSERYSQWVRVDFETSSVHMLDPRDGQVRITLTSEDFLALESRSLSPQLARQFVLLSPDSQEWTVQDLSDLPPILAIDMVGDTIFLTVDDGRGVRVLVGAIP